MPRCVEAHSNHPVPLPSALMLQPFPPDAIGRACCIACRSEFNAERSPHCPRCALADRHQDQPTPAESR